MSQRNGRSTKPESGSIALWLIHYAARRAPGCLTSRLEEEWLADVASRSSALSRLRFAAGCCWATMVIFNDYPRSRVPAAISVVAAKDFITVTDRNFAYFSLRSGTLFLIVGLHAALFCGLITMVSHTRAVTTQLNPQNHELSAVPPETR